MSEQATETTDLPTEPRNQTDPEMLASLSARIVAQDVALQKIRPADRVQHQKRVLAAFGVVRVQQDIPPEAKLGPFAVAGEHLAAVRFSNGQPVTFDDHAPDVRGVAVKFFTDEDTETDLLVTNEGGRSHARDAQEFVEIADILVDKIANGPARGLGHLTSDLLERKLAVSEAIRVVGILAKETALHKVESLVTEAYWGSVVKLGQSAVKYSLQPHLSTIAGTDADRNGPDFLRDDLLHRLAKGPVRFVICVQLFVNEEKTPVNDASIAWEAPLVAAGEVEIATTPTEEDQQVINSMAFNPSNGFEPLGITHARKEAYLASARNRQVASSEEVRREFAKRR